MNEMQVLLKEWGKGAHIRTPPNGYHKVSPGFQDSRNSGNASVRLPEQALEINVQIDYWVSSLKTNRLTEHTIITQRYMKNRLDEDIGAMVGRSTSWVRTQREKTEYWLAAKLGVHISETV